MRLDRKTVSLVSSLQTEDENTPGHRSGRGRSRETEDGSGPAETFVRGKVKPTSPKSTQFRTWARMMVICETSFSKEESGP
jgi:hypothetical protein